MFNLNTNFKSGLLITLLSIIAIVKSGILYSKSQKILLKNYQNQFYADKHLAHLKVVKAQAQPKSSIEPNY